MTKGTTTSQWKTQIDFIESCWLLNDLLFLFFENWLYKKNYFLKIRKSVKCNAEMDAVALTSLIVLQATLWAVHYSFSLFRPCVQPVATYSLQLLYLSLLDHLIPVPGHLK